MSFHAMIALLRQGYCDRTLQLLLKTIFGILTLRDGPDALPRSWFLFAAALAVIWSVFFAVSYLGRTGEPPDHVMSLALLAMHVASFWLIVQIAGFPQRFLQAVTASAVCGAFGSVLSLLLFLALAPVLGATVADNTAEALQLWLLMVDGHIIARSIGRHLLVGIALAIVVFFAQVVFYSAF
jgi:hypothetical protein